jgi:hypothetical protein
MFTTLFWKDTAERVLASAAGGALTLLAADGADVGNAGDLESWVVFVGVPALVSLCKAIVATQVRDSVSPASLAKVTPPEVPAHDPAEPPAPGN